MAMRTRASGSPSGWLQPLVGGATVPWLSSSVQNQAEEYSVLLLLPYPRPHLPSGFHWKPFILWDQWKCCFLGKFHLSWTPTQNLFLLCASITHCRHLYLLLISFCLMFWWYPSSLSPPPDCEQGRIWSALVSPALSAETEHYIRAQ